MFSAIPDRIGGLQFLNRLEDRGVNLDFWICVGLEISEESEQNGNYNYFTKLIPKRCFADDNEKNMSLLSIVSMMKCLEYPCLRKLIKVIENESSYGLVFEGNAPKSKTLRSIVYEMYDLPMKNTANPINVSDNFFNTFQNLSEDNLEISKSEKSDKENIKSSKEKSKRKKSKSTKEKRKSSKKDENNDHHTEDESNEENPLNGNEKPTKMTELKPKTRKRRASAMEDSMNDYIISSINNNDTASNGNFPKKIERTKSTINITDEKIKKFCQSLMRIMKYVESLQTSSFTFVYTADSIFVDDDLNITDVYISPVNVGVKTGTGNSLSSSLSNSNSSFNLSSPTGSSLSSSAYISTTSANQSEARIGLTDLNNTPPQKKSKSKSKSNSKSPTMHSSKHHRHSHSHMSKHTHHRSDSDDNDENNKNKDDNDNENDNDNNNKDDNENDNDNKNNDDNENKISSRPISLMGRSGLNSSSGNMLAMNNQLFFSFISEEEIVRFTPPGVITSQQMSDPWNLGVLLYFITRPDASLPFDGCSAEEIRKNVLHLHPKFDELTQNEDTQRTITRLLIKNPEMRPAVDVIKNWEYFLPPDLLKNSRINSNSMNSPSSGMNSPGFSLNSPVLRSNSISSLGNLRNQIPRCRNSTNTSDISISSFDEDDSNTNNTGDNSANSIASSFISKYIELNTGSHSSTNLPSGGLPRQSLEGSKRTNRSSSSLLNCINNNGNNSLSSHTGSFSNSNALSLLRARKNEQRNISSQMMKTNEIKSSRRNSISISQEERKKIFSCPIPSNNSKNKFDLAAAIANGDDDIDIERINTGFEGNEINKNEYLGEQQNEPNNEQQQSEENKENKENEPNNEESDERLSLQKKNPLTQSCSMMSMRVRITPRKTFLSLSKHLNFNGDNNNS